MTQSGLPSQSDARGSRVPSTASIVGTAMFAVGAFWALDVFGLGMMSLLVNRDVITDPRAGVGLGLAMVAAATLALVGGLIRVALKRAVTVRVTTIVSIVALVYLAYLLGGTIFWALFAGGLATDGLFFALGMARDWPSLVIGFNALIVTLAYFATLSYRMKHQDPFDPSRRSG